MNEATLNSYNSISFPPAQEAYRVTDDSFYTLETDPVASAISRGFGRFTLLLILTLIVVAGILFAAAQGLAAAGHRHSQVPAAAFLTVASATVTPDRR